MLTHGTVFLAWNMSTWVCSISLLTVLVAHLHMRAEQATIILMPTKIQIIMGSSVNPILLRPVLGTVLAIDSELLKMEQLMSWSWSQSGHPAVRFSPLVAVRVSVKQLRSVHQTLKDSGTLLACSLTARARSFVTRGGLGDLSFSTDKPWGCPPRGSAQFH